jgi:hypothetical protein
MHLMHQSFMLILKAEAVCSGSTSSRQTQNILLNRLQSCGQRVRILRPDNSHKLAWDILDKVKELWSEDLETLFLIPRRFWQQNTNDDMQPKRKALSKKKHW